MRRHGRGSQADTVDAVPVSPTRFVVVLDADSTLFCDEVIELIADEAGRAAEVASVTEAAMRGEVDFAESLRARVRHLAGVRTATFADVAARVRPTPGASDLIRAVHDRGGVVGVVSGGFHEVLDIIAPRLGVDMWRANRLKADAGVLSGDLNGEIVDAAGKARALAEWTAECGVPPSRAIAVGDGANDLRMMSVAGLGLAFNAKPIVRAHADIVAGRVDLREIIPLLP